MEITSHGISIDLTHEEAVALHTLLGNMSDSQMQEFGTVDEEEAKILRRMFYNLAEFV